MRAYPTSNTYETPPNPVSNPLHYNQGTIEAIDYIKDSMPSAAFRGYLEGAIKKYLHRYRYKGKPIEDLEKAQWYLGNLIDDLKTENKVIDEMYLLP